MIRERKLLMVAVGLVLMAGLAKVERRGPKPPFASSQAIPPARVALASDYGKLPLSFERNDGQIDRQVKFLSRGNGYTLFLTPSEAVLALLRPQGSSEVTLPASKPRKVDTEVLRVKLVGAHSNPQVEGLDQQVERANYFIGNDAKKWRRNVPTFARVKYRNVWPGINLISREQPASVRV
jgi:hypothetical protein